MIKVSGFMIITTSTTTTIIIIIKIIVMVGTCNKSSIHNDLIDCMLIT